jgi:alcohol dehydrogenase
LTINAFIQPPPLIAGYGSSQQVSEYLRENQYENVLVISDSSVVNTGTWESFLKSFDESQLEVTVHSIAIHREPTYAMLSQVSTSLQEFERPDVIIGIGGGSLLDIAKASAALLMNPGNPLEYRGFDRLTHPGVPVLAIPTTAGSGSEATPNAVFTDTIANKKLGINGRHVAARYAVLDAAWQSKIPADVAISAGLDALVHALESFVARGASTVSRAYSSMAIALIFRSFSRSLNLGDSDRARYQQEMLTASFFASTALFNSGSGISGALSYPIGVDFGVPHGYAGGITLPSVVEWNIERGYYDYGLLTAGNRRAPDKDAAQDFLRDLNELYTAIGAPRNFARWNLTKRELPALLTKSLALQGAYDQNSVLFPAEKGTREILQAVLE